MVNDSNEPVPITPEIKNHVTIHVIGIFVDAPHFLEIMPSGGINDGLPILDFTSRVLVLCHRPFQMFYSDDVHSLTELHNM